MSMPRGMKITCPECKNEGKFTIWHSINVDVNPETRNKVKTGNIFKYECENCGKVFSVEYRFLYHDISNRFMIWYFPRKEYDINKELEELNRGQVSEIFNKNFNEKLRMVDDKRSLIEKINIFEDRLNDLIIEIIKNIILEQIQDQSVEIFYNGMEDDMLKFWITNNKGAGFPYDSYIKILNDYIVSEPQKCAIIDKNTVFGYVELKK